MRIRIIAVGEKPPEWVKQALADYSKRIPHPFTPEIIEIAAGNRGKGRDAARAIAEEGQRVIAALPKSGLVIALDERGKQWSSVDLSQQFAAWQLDGRDVSILIGGPDGHAAEVMAMAEKTWSLSALTLPHALVRVVLVEQLYRAWSLLSNHPYHRA